jgi:inositol oxygenase
LQEAFNVLEGFIDPSDPDVDFSNHIHNFQTAESCRKLLPDVDWFHLVGLLHDVGKLLYIFGEPTWAIVGDTFVVGHPFNNACVYSEFFKDNPDYLKSSIYKAHCGFDNVHLSWGHDEYLYQVLTHNNTSLPEEALYIIRYHSFYPWHDQGAYSELASKKDEKLLEWLKLFNSCDLYSKVDDIIDYEKIKTYYDSLIAKYLPAKIRFYKPPHVTVNLG